MDEPGSSQPVPYTRILVPYASPNDAPVLAEVERFAKLSGAEVVLLRVAHYHTRDTKMAEIDESTEILSRAAERLARSGVRVRTLIGHGEVGETIVAEAQELHVDLIAMAAHHHGRLGRAIPGSVIDAVRRDAVAPLLLVRVPKASRD
jgi:nucleotide-binding universal stress UspA family protein